MPSYSGVWNLVAVYQAVGAENWPSVDLTRALFFGGYPGGSEVNVIDYVRISVLGNATDFGDLTQTLSETAACGSTSRGVVFGGHPPGAGGLTVNVIQYVTFSTIGNAASFGTLSVGKWGGGSCNSSTRGIFAGGRTSTPADTNAIEYIEIATTGNSTNFGNLTQARHALAGFSSSTRGVFAGGNNSGVVNTIDYITIATTGNALDFGDTSAAAEVWCAACSNSTRGLIHLDSGNIIEYVTIATTGNTTDFGDLLASASSMSASASPTRGLFAGAYAASNVIQYVTIATTGNAIDFGDLTVARGYLSSASNNNGGVQ